MNKPVNLKQGARRVLNNPKNNLQAIEKPKESLSGGILKIFIYLLAILVILFTLYSQWYKPKQISTTTDNNSWYAIELVNGKVFFGQINSLEADPIVVRNAYYDYDDDKNSNSSPDKSNLRLVKRGKEMHGPDGAINLIRSQVVLIEELADNSEVLRVILDNEK